MNLHELSDSFQCRLLRQTGISLCRHGHTFALRKKLEGFSGVARVVRLRFFPQIVRVSTWDGRH